ncbi:MAG: hypothetical protein JWM80_1350 [Cyanobacteria bacterium RYN_339]|nr:hypothetical protein [Cyanobacteria bacterium RYN_339]
MAGGTVRADVVAEAAKLSRAADFLRGRVESTLELLVTAQRGPVLDAILARLQTLEDAAERAEQLGQTALALEPAQALAELKGFAYIPLVTELRRIEAEITKLRTGPAAPPPPRPRPSALPTGHLVDPRARVTGSLTDKLKGFFGPPQRAVPEAIAPPGPERLALEALDAVLRFVTDLLGYVGPRLAPVICALETCEGAPQMPVVALMAMGRRVAEERLATEARGWVPHLVKLFHGEPTSLRRARVATTQWEQLRALHDSAVHARVAAFEQEARQRQLLIGEIPVAKLRGASLPLANLHLTFAGTPYLQDIFPAPAPKKR